MKYYIGFNWDNKLRTNNEYPYCFLSVAVNYSKYEYKKLVGWKINNAQDIMLDSGGFSLLNRFGDYPFSIDTFVQWVHEMNKENDNKVNSVATPDYPCEEEINRKCKYKTNYERIYRTVQNAEECMDLYPEINWMPVIQGYEPSEYELCLNLYRDAGIKPEKFAIGSMCRRLNVKKIEYHIKNLIENGLKEKIHIFGLCKTGMKSKYLFDNVDSCDSIGYTFNAVDQKDTKKRFDDMLDTVGGYMIMNREQMSLWDYIKI